MAEAHDQPYAHFENPAESATMSLWRHNIEAGRPEYQIRTNFPPLTGHLQTEVAIIGAGITGLSTAIMLERSGFEVTIVDAHPVGYGVTGFNSGHLTSVLLDTPFRDILPAFGEEATRALVMAIEEGMNLIERMVHDYRIDCEFRWVPGYLFTEKAEQLKTLQEEYEAMAKAGIQANRTFNVPLPFPIEEGIHVSNQAVIDPLKYTQSLALRLQKLGCGIYENSRVTDIENKGPHNGYFIQTEAGTIQADEVVIATHTPIGFRPLSQIRMEPWRSYVIGVRSQSRMPDALFWDMEAPYHYIRLANDEKGPLLLIGGEDHKTGESVNTRQRFRNLEAFARKRFDVQSIDYEWSAQFYASADGLPYIGKTNDGYIATGFSGEGLTYGTLAARMIADQIQGIPNPCGEILSPYRAKPIASAGGVLAEGISTMSHYIGDRLKKTTIEKPEDVPEGTGALCTVEGQKVAVYKSPEGILHTLSPVCTHMNCLVGWNPTEKSWDCPCHGGRFDATGKVLNGPPVVDLAPVDLARE